MYHGCDKINQKNNLTFDPEVNLIFCRSEIYHKILISKKEDSLPGQRSNSFFGYFIATVIHSCTNFKKNYIYSLKRIFLACVLEYDMHALVAICKNKEFYRKGHRMVKNRRIKMPFFSKMFEKCFIFTSLISIALNLINYHQ